MNRFDVLGCLSISRTVNFSPSTAGGIKKTASGQKEENGNKRKGFASMSILKRKDIAKRGGDARKKAAESGLAPSYSQIGQKGGKAGTKAKK
jgi:hypothetical protein